MAQLPPAVARTRTAVRDHLDGLPPDGLILVACSGGPDSMALAAACGFVAPRRGLRVGLVTVDHGMQPGSAHQARVVADWAATSGLAPVEIAAVQVDTRRGGPEAAARDKRYAALHEAADRLQASAVMLGHTRDDQAETVLLALARGAGPHGISGMPSRRDKLVRPFLGLSRAETVRACQELELPTWDDPHNQDPSYTRSRLRAAMPVLTKTLGDRLVANLARTATLVAEDNRVLKALADDLLAKAMTGDRRLSIEVLAGQPRALRTRVLRAWVKALGVTGDLTSVHIDAMDALVADWHGQGAAQMPGGRSVGRHQGSLHLS